MIKPRHDIIEVRVPEHLALPKGTKKEQRGPAKAKRDIRSSLTPDGGRYVYIGVGINPLKNWRIVDGMGMGWTSQTDTGKQVAGNLSDGSCVKTP